jgi:hypothetical protein
MSAVAAALRTAAAILVIPNCADGEIPQCSHSLTSFMRSFAALRITETKLSASMRGGALVDGAVFRHLVIFHQAEPPIDQGLFVFVS